MKLRATRCHVLAAGTVVSIKGRIPASVVGD